MTETTNPLASAQALALGVVGGMRSQLPLALLANAPAAIDDSASLLHAPLVRRLSALVAGAELVADKLPGIGSRLEPGPFVTRLLIGGIAGGVVIGRANQPRLAGIALGAAGAAVGAWAGYHLRARLVSETQAPDFVYAVAEDLTALTIGVLAVQRPRGAASAQSRPDN